ncbi:hypothetical protein C8R46DRAFT_36592 [Mycena filopes]|nr:hypothetical protein C8R46DRAFT_36592 [Mycena filopes]
MPFDKLDTDVLLPIFSLTDVYTILSLSSVSKSLRTIAHTKQLWIIVVHNLSHRGIIGPGDSWATFSTEELIGEVRRTVAGPRTWDRGAIPSVQRQIAIPLDHDSGQTGRLTHGGRYIVFHHRYRRFELWDILSRSRIWVLDPPALHISAWEIDFSARAGRAVVFLLCGPPPYYGTPWNPLVIVDVDLQTGLSAEVFRLALPAPVPLLRNFTFAGELFLCHVCLPSSLLLVNWRTAEFISIDTDGQLGRSFASFPGHIVLRGDGTPGTTQIQERVLIYALASLKPRWKPLCNLVLDTPARLAHITPIVLAPPPDAFERRIGKISVCKSTLHDDVYTLTITSSDSVLVPSPSPSPSILERIRSKLVAPRKLWVETRTRYRIFAPRNAAHFSLPLPPPTLLDVLRKPFNAHWRFADIAPSGYGVGWGPIKLTPSPHEGRIVFFHYLRDVDSASFRRLPTTGDEPEQGEVRDMRGMSVEMSDTGVVMLKYPARVELLWYS